MCDPRRASSTSSHTLIYTHSHSLAHTHHTQTPTHRCASCDAPLSLGSINYEFYLWLWFRRSFLTLRNCVNCDDHLHLDQNEHLHHLVACRTLFTSNWFSQSSREFFTEFPLIFLSSLDTLRGHKSNSVTVLGRSLYIIGPHMRVQQLYALFPFPNLTLWRSTWGTKTEKKKNNNSNTLWYARP